jgi:catechol 2,3-dioxygenase-like lactoylglutathione lyase family enzyme
VTRPPVVDCDRVHPELAVPDLAAALDFYTTRLGFAPGFTWGEPPTFAGVRLGEAEVFLNQAPAEGRRATLFFAVGDADELHAFHRAGGVEVVQEIGDRDYGMRDYAVRDPFGHVLVFGQHAFGATEPPLPIQRVDVPVRLETRLAALLHDLAAHKRMTLSSCLEEILLHTCEPLGDGVASPHTRATLRHLQALKKKHGIDYDTHASYRFVEAEEGPPLP